MRILKYFLNVTDRQTVPLPIGAKILTVQEQHGGLMLWAEVDESMPASTYRNIAIYGTGNPIPDKPGRYISTVQMGGFVWHIYELED